MTALLLFAANRVPALVATSGERASYRFFEFFSANIRNPNTRRAYAHAAHEFFDWLDQRAEGTSIPTGITAYLKNGGTLEKAAAMANHSSTRTTQLYDRCHDEMSLDEIERIVI
ncbi:hypothetical protein [Rhodoblastus sp.]|uniref:hypothetical protein n=1 Tax=Rhodoblastus sp. TaxID=1962975 RepID=UPI003F96DD5A